MKEHKETIECECHSHRIEVEYDDIDEDHVYLTMWYMGGVTTSGSGNE